ncbi:hypothetical protein HII31_00380 [Pseudocercospora fuligena]|uniref:Calcineurin-like phosphoesterase domain-containing protein n=1 Tax=Pseudocercospora fuligena TaxID=685502 RepID=A0A8H6RWX4_9PEZI|nr:hypothetical protein HII31_00380 [Pseudocercospora fuligena]
MPTLQIISDLHLESPKAYDVFDIVPRAPHLALLGDIGNVVAHKGEFFGFITKQLRQFQAVLFVPGNHEAYGSDWPSTLRTLKYFEEDVKRRRKLDSEHDRELGEFVLLDRGTFELAGTHTDQPIIMLGCSLFSHVPPEREMAVEMGLQDFFQIGSWDIDAHNKAHARDLEWLNGELRGLEQKDAKLVIPTHWSPTVDSRSIDPRHAGSSIVAGFSTDLKQQPCFLSENVVLWAFGHTHYKCDFAHERENASPIRLVTNQRGYYFAQAQGFDPEKVIEL